MSYLNKDMGLMDGMSVAGQHFTQSRFMEEAARLYRSGKAIL